MVPFLLLIFLLSLVSPLSIKVGSPWASLVSEERHYQMQGWNDVNLSPLPQERLKGGPLGSWIFGRVIDTWQGTTLNSKSLWNHLQIHSELVSQVNSPLLECSEHQIDLLCLLEIKDNGPVLRARPAQSIGELLWFRRACTRVDCFHLNALGEYADQFLSAWLNVEPGNLSWEMASVMLVCRHVYEGILLINNCCGRSQPTVGNVISGHVAQACIRKQVEKAVEWASKRHASIISASVPASRCLPCLSSGLGSSLGCTVIGACEPKRPFPLKPLLVMVFIIVTEKQTESGPVRTSLPLTISLFTLPRLSLEDKWVLQTLLYQVLDLLYGDSKMKLRTWGNHDRIYSCEVKGLAFLNYSKEALTLELESGLPFLSFVTLSRSWNWPLLTRVWNGDFIAPSS